MSEKKLTGLILTNNETTTVVLSGLPKDSINLLRTTTGGTDGEGYFNGKRYFTMKEIKQHLLTTDRSSLLPTGNTEIVFENIGWKGTMVDLHVTSYGQTSVLTTATVKVSYDGTDDYYTCNVGQHITFEIPPYCNYTLEFQDEIGWYTPLPISGVSDRMSTASYTATYNEKPKPIDLSLRDINGNERTARETANCYVLHGVGDYRFPLVYGCSIMDDKVNNASFTQVSGHTQPFYNANGSQITDFRILDDTHLSLTGAEVVLNDAEDFKIGDFYFTDEAIILNGTLYTVKYLNFKCTEIPELGGNITLAIKGGGHVIWSWHLWGYPYTLTDKHHNNGTDEYDFLDVNLGWVKESVNSKYGTSPYYQWGRKDPMLRAKSYVENVPADVVEGTFSTGDTASQFFDCIYQPNKFFKGSSASSYNWWKNGSTNVDFYNYWDYTTSDINATDKVTKKTIYDPCPAEYAVPCGNAFSGFTKTNGGIWDLGWTWDERYFPAAGYRLNTGAGINNNSLNGAYWSTDTYSQTGGCGLVFNSTTVAPRGNLYKSYGLPIIPTRMKVEPAPIIEYDDLSLVDVNGLPRTMRETANCYVLHEPGNYCFPLVYGCSIMDDEVNAASFTEIKSEYTQPFYNADNQQISDFRINVDLNREAVSAEIIWKDSSSFTISDFSFENRLLIIDGQSTSIEYLLFNCSSVPSLGGNAMLVVKDANGDIMWSWHIWAYPYLLTDKRHNNGTANYDFMDVNLGWVKDGDISKYGHSPHYQWGRKDPIPRYNAWVEGVSNFVVTGTASSLGETIKNPHHFNITPNDGLYTYKWWINGTLVVDFYNYWDYETIDAGYTDKVTCKTIYDPCPVEYAVPCGNAFNGFSETNGGTWDLGWTWDERYFPTDGHRRYSDGDFKYIGINGYYWTSAVNSQPNNYNLTFNSINVYPHYADRTAGGFSIAPVHKPQSTVKAIDLSLVSPLNGLPKGDTKEIETANCYVLHATGSYEFPLVYGCSIMNSEVNVKSFTKDAGNDIEEFYNALDIPISDFRITNDLNVDSLDSLVCNVVMKDSDDFIVNDFSFTEKDILLGTEVMKVPYVRFKCANIPDEGANLTLTVGDKDNVFWSWHLWGYKPTIELISNISSDESITYEAMDVNLGWVRDTTNTGNGTCPYYQWGRKDPMLRYGAKAANPNFVISSKAAFGVGQSIQNPNTFYDGAGVYNNWWTDKDSNTHNFFNYWNWSQAREDAGVPSKDNPVLCKTVYDPCPRGFAVPTGYFFDNFTLPQEAFDEGYMFRGRFYPAIGLIMHGTHTNIYKNGYYWSSSVNNTTSTVGKALNFADGSIDTFASGNNDYATCIVPVRMVTMEENQ